MKLPRGLALTLAGGLSPWLARWATGLEKRILAEGEMLPVALMDFAKSLGILRPEEIRVREMKSIPLPVSEFWVRLGKKFGLPVFPPGGMAIGRGIFLAPETGRRCGTNWCMCCNISSSAASNRLWTGMYLNASAKDMPRRNWRLRRRS